ncbi:MAG: transposase [Ardenticatenia bacterium]|nr:transposase [Ardenticatenia bacterium]
MSLERLEYDADAGTVTYTSDKADGPTAGRHTFEVTDFIARMVAHIPDKGQVLQRTYGYYPNRRSRPPLDRPAALVLAWWARRRRSARRRRLTEAPWCGSGRRPRRRRGPQVRS